MNIKPTNRLTRAIVMFLARHTPRCHDMTRLISQELETAHPPGTRLRMRLHFWICAWCQRYRDQLRLMRKAMHRCDEQHPPAAAPKLSSDTKDRLKEALTKPS